VGVDDAFMRCPPLSQKGQFAHFRAVVTPFPPENGVNHERQPFDFQLNKEDRS
jgi:hypothetical protein